MRAQTLSILLLCYLFTVGCKESETQNIAPEENRFTKTELVSNLDEPMELAILPNGSIIFIERKGSIKIFNRYLAQMDTLATLSVFSGLEDGLLGLTLDPQFKQNNFLYLFYSPTGSDSVQRVSRFTLKDEQWDFSSEKILLEIPVQRKECCHSAGSLAFGPDGNLFIAVGDNTNPHNPGYYNSIDEREGREFWDSQRTAANTNDLRGKILRIKPKNNGTYSIPTGNLFSKDSKNSKPEIYAMGCRNPYRIQVDQQTGILYWGDVGQNTEDNPSRGPISYDEFHQAKSPGFFGWPYFAGNNRPYTDFDFATNLNGEFFDPLKPINNSKNNTGNKILPPAQGALIWYSYEEDTTVFKNLGSGGKSPIIGPVYYQPKSIPDWSSTKSPLPKYYEGKLFIAEWMRDWINVVTLDKNGNLFSIERLMPSTKFDHPIDLEFGPDGSLYVLEYGTFWFSQNKNARLTVIEFNAGNRAPIAMIEADKTSGSIPLEINFNANQSFDFDTKDELKFEWTVGNQKKTGKTLSHLFQLAGVHEVSLNVTDSHGLSHSQSISITAGNQKPKVHVTIKGNQTFYWPDKPILYTATVSDFEDGTIEKGINSQDIVVALNKIDVGSGADFIKSINSSPKENSSIIETGLNLMNQSDCKSCHHAEIKSVGPTYKQISERYPKASEEEIMLLSNKVIKGGNGNWGEVAMSAHPQISLLDAKEITKYILETYSPNKKSNRIPINGIIIPEKKNINDYLFSVTYQDKGAGIAPPLSSSKYFLLRWSTISVDKNDGRKFTSRMNDGVIRFTQSGAYIMFSKIDMTEISEVIYTLTSSAVGTVELRLNSPDGKLISEADLSQSKSQVAQWPTIKSKVELTEGIKNIYVIYRNEKANTNKKREVFDLVSATFQ